MLDLSKIEAGKLELSIDSVEVAPLMDDALSTVRPLAEKNGNRLEVACAGPLGAMLADHTRARQVLFNLLSNACKFTENGLIRVEARRVRRKGVDWVEFRVTDTGIGMNAEQVERLFRPFMQADCVHHPQIRRDRFGIGHQPRVLPDDGWFFERGKRIG